MSNPKSSATNKSSATKKALDIVNEIADQNKTSTSMSISAENTFLGFCIIIAGLTIAEAISNHK